MRVMWHTECWLDNIADIIDEGERNAGVSMDINTYADIAHGLRSSVNDRLVVRDHLSVAWSYQQSVGVGVLVQSATEEERAAFDAAMDAERGWVVDQVRTEVEAEKEFLAREAIDG